MSATRGPWAWWLRRCQARMDARILALLRILASACVVADLLRVWQLGLVEDLFRLYESGGINGHPDPQLWVIDLLGPDGGVVAFWLTLCCFALVGLGLFTRPAMVLGLVAWAQLGHLYGPGDRGVDRILRTVFLLLLLSGCHRRWALGLRFQPGAAREWVRAWPADLVRWLMVLVYLSAGSSKLMQTTAWLEAPDLPVVYRIMTDPMAAHVDPEAAMALWPLWVFFGWATIAVELSSPLLLTRLAPWWSLCALPMHLGIATTMELGMFSWGIMSLHVLLLMPWLLPLMDRIPLLRNPAPAGPAAGSPAGTRP